MSLKNSMEDSVNILQAAEVMQPYRDRDVVIGRVRGENRGVGASSMKSEINKSYLNKPSDIHVLSLNGSLSDVVSPEFDESLK